MLYQVLTGKQPTLLTESFGEEFLSFKGDILGLPSPLPNPTHPIWGLAKRCWALNQNDRPQLDEIRNALKEYGPGWLCFLRSESHQPPPDAAGD
jgi:hypothetical protein